MITIAVPIYNTEVIIYHSSEVPLTELIDKELFDDVESWAEFIQTCSTAKGVTNVSTNRLVTIYVDTPPKLTPVLVHELYHASHLILDQVGIPQGENTVEATAYLLEFLVESYVSQIGDK